MLPDQISGTRVQRLDRVGHIRRQEHHAVVHERRNLLSHTVFERPRPFQLQPSGVLRCDLIQRAVAPPGVIAVVHQPIRVWRSRKHLFGDRRVIPHRACYGESRTRRSWRLSSRRRLRVRGRLALHVPVRHGPHPSTQAGRPASRQWRLTRWARSCSGVIAVEPLCAPFALRRNATICAYVSSPRLFGFSGGIDVAYQT